MATWRIPIFGSGTRFDNVGEPFLEPSQTKFGDGAADELLLVFPFSSTRDGVFGSFEVPDNYSASTTDPAIIIPWTTTQITNDVEWDFDYWAIGVGEDFDPAAVTETVNQNDTAPGTTKQIQSAVLTLTRANIAANDIIRFGLFRDQTDAGDTITIWVAVSIDNVMFRYDDA